jgi:hypothetical protein
MRVLRLQEQERPEQLPHKDLDLHMLVLQQAG